MILTEYYSQRAHEYESIYHRDDPVRQAEQREIANKIRALCKRRRVLEVACGTGYWTRAAATVATQICAVDLSAEMINIARTKSYTPAQVDFQIADAYALTALPGDFDAAFAVFWFSHVPKGRLQEFLLQFHAMLKPQATVFMADNVFVPGLGGELVSDPASPDTFKLRKLKDGSVHRILKNYYSESELHEIFSTCATALCVTIGQCFWQVSYTLRK
jgi:ubiquinone/menaquinone biosynthesis C-methylase UbiE